MAVKSKKASEPKAKLHPRMPFSSSSVLLPNGTTLVMRVDLQEGGGFYVGHSFIARDNSVTAGETCFYCGDEKLGCMKCPKGQSPHGDCIKKTIKCESNNAIGMWSPGRLVFNLG